jgi:hypothetical protein
MPQRVVVVFSAHWAFSISERNTYNLQKYCQTQCALFNIYVKEDKISRVHNMKADWEGE